MSGFSEFEDAIIRAAAAKGHGSHKINLILRDLGINRMRRDVGDYMEAIGLMRTRTHADAEKRAQREIAMEAHQGNQLVEANRKFGEAMAGRKYQDSRNALPEQPAIQTRDYGANHLTMGGVASYG